MDRCLLGWAIPPAGGKPHGCRCGQRRRRNTAACLPTVRDVHACNLCACRKYVRAKGKPVIIVDLSEQLISKNLAANNWAELLFDQDCAYHIFHDLSRGKIDGFKGKCYNKMNDWREEVH